MKMFFALLSFAASVAFADGSALVALSSERTFAPRGFDDNDQIQIVIEGKLDNDCYRLDQPRVIVDESSHQVRVQPMGRYFQWHCLEVMVPWTQVIQVGHLPAGDWSISVEGQPQPERMSVNVSNTVSPDDFVYAPVDSLSVNARGAVATATIKGHFSTRCADFEEIKVIDSGKTIEILPIMRAGTAARCERADTQFEKVITLPAKAAGRYLVHVRSLNGQALNQVFEVR